MTKRNVEGRRQRAAGLLLAVMAAALVAGPAQAQVDACERPEPPAVPDGKTADYREMRFAEAEVDVYAYEMAAYLDCLREEQDDAIAEKDGVWGDWWMAADAFGPLKQRVRRVGAAASGSTWGSAGNDRPSAAPRSFGAEPSRQEP